MTRLLTAHGSGSGNLLLARRRKEAERQGGAGSSQAYTLRAHVHEGADGGPQQQEAEEIDVDVSCRMRSGTVGRAASQKGQQAGKQASEADGMEIPHEIQPGQEAGVLRTSPMWRPT